MRRKMFVAGATILTAGLVSVAPEAPAPVGPGGVLDTIQQVCAALDQGDRAFLEKAFVDEATGMQFTTRADGSFKGLKRGSLDVFFDVTPEGKRLGAKTKAEFVAQVAGRIATSKKAGRALSTRIKSIEANCPAANCSYAVVEFDRTYELEGKEKVVPMRATALLRYNGGQPHFQLFHWHASEAKGATKVAKR